METFYLSFQKIDWIAENWNCLFCRIIETSFGLCEAVEHWKRNQKQKRIYRTAVFRGTSTGITAYANIRLIKYAELLSFYDEHRFENDQFYRAYVRRFQQLTAFIEWISHSRYSPDSS